MKYSVFGKGNEIVTKGRHIRGSFFGKTRNTCLWTGFSEIGKTSKKKNINIKVIINTIRKQVHGRDTWHTRVNIV